MTDQLFTRSAQDLLRESMAAHNRALPGRDRKRPDGWLELLREASRLRSEALIADPDMTSPGWERHEQFVAFYKDKLGSN